MSSETKEESTGKSERFVEFEEKECLGTESITRMSTRSTIKVSRIVGRRKNSVECAAKRGGDFSPQEAQWCKSASGLGETMESVQQVTEADHEARKRLGV